MLLFALLACSSEPSVPDTEPLGRVIADLTDPTLWEAHPGVGATQCSLGPGTWSLRHVPADTPSGYCWLGLRQPIHADGPVAFRARWSTLDADAARIQAELHGSGADQGIDWPADVSGSGTRLVALTGPTALALRLAVTCERCRTPAGLQVDQLEIVVLDPAE